MALGDRMTKWPGYGFEENGSYQFNEQEFMKAEDYDAFLKDPADWAIRVYTPRLSATVKGWPCCRPLGMFLFGYYNTFNFPVSTAPPVVSAFKAIYKAAQELLPGYGQSMVSANAWQRWASRHSPCWPI